MNYTLKYSSLSNNCIGKIYLLWYKKTGIKNKIMVFIMNLSCGVTGIPQIERVGEYPLINADFNFTYQPPTHSIHLYDYQGSLKLDNELISFNAGDLTCEPTGHTYSINSDNPGKHWCIHFFAPVQPDVSTFEVPNYIKLGGDSVFIVEQIKHISHLANSDSEMALLEASYRLKALSLSLSNLHFGEKKTVSRSNFVWDELIELIEVNLSVPISSTWLASKLNISAVTLAQKFKKKFNCTIANYILRKGIDRAKSLLTTTRYTVSEVGTATGIDNPQYFNKQFRKVCGVSPSRYRDENKPYLVSTDKDISIANGQWQEE